MGSVSHWQDEAARAMAHDEHVEPLRGQQTADVAIVGAGVTGTALAIELARAGAKVAVVEARQIAAGASGRNGGFLLGGTSETYAESIVRFGHERAKRIWAFSQTNNVLARARIEELAALGWDCGYRNTGSMRLAMTEAELLDIYASADQLHDDGWTAHVLARSDLPASLRAVYLGGTYHQEDGQLQPARYVRGLAKLARDAGATIYEDSPVTALREDETGVEVTVEGGTLRAKHLVLATNAWLPELGAMLGIGWLAKAVTPTRGQMLVTAPLAQRIFDCPIYADEGYQYWRQLDDGRLAIGGWRNHSFGTEFTLDETAVGPVQSYLDTFVHETLGLADLAIERRWAGIMAFSADELPLVGHLPGTAHSFVAGAYTGHGNAYALSCARIVAALINGEMPADADLFDPARFATGEPIISAAEASRA